jgi:CubicO group peptidase (beta-lactamase class C family)
VKSGEIVHEKGYGLANIQHGVPVTSGTLFHIGSVTKSVTALAVLHLHDRGLISIDDPIAAYLPDVAHGDEITIRHLLSHTAGVAGREDGALEFAPGEKMAYSNHGYQLLGQLIQKVSGESYADYLSASIFEPLGMQHTGPVYHAPITKGLASGYLVSESGGYINAGCDDLAVTTFSAGGLYSSARDLYLLDRALTTGALLKPETAEQAFSPTKLNDGKESPYGLGWMVGSHRGLREIGHGGDVDGFNCWLSRYPEQECTVIVLSNVGMRPPGPLPTARRLAYQIAGIYLGDVMTPEERQEVVAVDPAVLDTYVGHYALEGPQEVLDVMGYSLTIGREGDQLLVTTQMGTGALVAHSQTRFSVPPNEDVTLTFVADDAGEVTGIIIDMMGVREVRGKRTAGAEQSGD